MSPGAGAAQRIEVIDERLARKRALLAQTEQEIAALEAQRQNWQAGLDGELLVAAELQLLRAEGWQLLHDVHWPSRPQANLDHVAVGPGGVVVVDAKNWSGLVRVTGAVLRNGTWRKTRECENAAQMAADVAALLPPQQQGSVLPVLCLVGQPLPPTAVEAGVVAVGDSHLADHLRSLPRQLGDDDVRVVAAQLRELLDGAVPPVPAPSLVGTAAAGPAPTPAPAPVQSPQEQTRHAQRAGSAGERRPHRRQAPSGREHVVVKIALVAVVGAAFYTWVQMLG